MHVCWQIGHFKEFFSHKQAPCSTTLPSSSFDIFSPSCKSSCGLSNELLALSIAILHSCTECSWAAFAVCYVCFDSVCRSTVRQTESCLPLALWDNENTTSKSVHIFTKNHGDQDIPRIKSENEKREERQIILVLFSSRGTWEKWGC